MNQLQILTNGMYKSHIHRVIVGNNKVQRISVVGIHGPPLDKLISPSTQFVDEEHPKKYREMTFKESLVVNGDDEIDVQSSLEKARLVWNLYLISVPFHTPNCETYIRISSLYRALLNML